MHMYAAPAPARRPRAPRGPGAGGARVTVDRAVAYGSSCALGNMASEPPGLPLSTEDAYLLDLNGFVVIRDALSVDEVDRLNSIVDAHSDQLEQSVSLAGGPDSRAMRGSASIVARIGAFVGVRIGPDALEQQLAALAFPPPHGKQPQPVGLDGKQRVMRGLATVEELRAALLGLTLDDGGRALTPDDAEQFISCCSPDADGVLTVGSTRGVLRQHDAVTGQPLPGPFEWAAPDCLPFRDLITNKVVKPRLEAILGPKYRLESRVEILEMKQGSDGHSLHGGAFDRFSGEGFAETFVFQAGRMRAGMVVLEFMLAHEGPGDGGLAIVRPPPARHPSRHRSVFLHAFTDSSRFCRSAGPTNLISRHHMASTPSAPPS
eukprot:SAG22_NODE_1686_length_3810_cov_13.829695_3_plen_376_part_00